MIEELKKINSENIKDIHKFDLVVDNDSVGVNVYNEAGYFVNQLFCKEIVKDVKE
jgi:hypothetical protein